MGNGTCESHHLKRGSWTVVTFSCQTHRAFDHAALMISKNSKSTPQVFNIKALMSYKTNTLTAAEPIKSPLPAAQACSCVQGKNKKKINGCMLGYL